MSGMGMEEGLGWEELERVGGAGHELERVGGAAWGEGLREEQGRRGWGGAGAGEGHTAGMWFDGRLASLAWCSLSEFLLCRRTSSQ